MIRSRADLRRVRRMVVKIGSALLADAEAGVRRDRMAELAGVVAGLAARGVQTAVVSSGAVALGRVRLGWVGRDLSVHEKQAAAAIGQPELMRAWSEAFDRHGMRVAQMLLTKDDLRHRRRYLNASNTSETLFSAGVVPVVNENDTVVVEEIKFGDNDALGAMVGLLIDADLVAMLTDVDGLYDRAPDAPGAARVGVVRRVSAAHEAMVGGQGSAFGTGGMASKLKAARIATRGGVAAAIVSGEDARNLARLLDGEDVGTLFLCGEDRRSRRQHWIADILHPAGRLHVDAGAARALRELGSSLLPVGVVRVEGRFDKGDCVEIVHQGQVVARGLCNYNADEVRRIQGRPSGEIERALGWHDFSSLVHRDNLVLMSETAGDTEEQ